MKTTLTILITAALAALATWWALKPAASTDTAATGERKVLFYQSAMHPWIKSDKPGRCTICGMELTPVYEGEKGIDESGDGRVVSLTQSQIQVLHVQTETARKQPLVRSLRVAGAIDDDATRHRVLSAYVDGRIEKLHVNYIGAEVREGQPLAEIYSPSLLQAEREYRQLTGELKDLTALRLKQMGLTPAQIAAVQDKAADSLTSSILAPATGTVVERSVYEGQYVATGQPLFEIADFSTMWFLFEVYEQDLPWIKTGQKVSVTTPSLPGKSFEGRVVFIDPNVNESTRATQVRVELPNPLVDGRRQLQHRLYADGVVTLEAPEVLCVPRSAVIQTGPQAVAYVDLGGGAYEQRALTLGRRGDQLVEVLGGLADGDAVVTNGNLLIDGQAEMNRAFMAPPASTTATPAPAAPQADVSAELAAFLQTADAMSAALGADKLDDFRKASAAAMERTAALIAKLGADAKDTSKLEAASHFHEVTDLKAARIAFHSFSVAAVALLEPLRKVPGTPAFEVYECGMVDEGIPGVPPKARWIQTGGRKLLNPFFGSEMAECGKTIQP
ncbi:MAG TPA: efflux RND transporter periplasmic adaptor subunit [Luteolibacter sp.]|nr:efflux RND transporter periplasmic adaptor subunit [Luteolibacter sp.]